MAARFEEVADSCFIGVEARARIGEVDHNRVQPFHDVERRPARGIAAAIHVIDRHAGGGVFRVLDVGGVECAGDAVLRAEDGIERNPGNVSQHINGAAAFGIDAGLVGQQADAARGAAFRRMQRREVVTPREHRFRFHCAIAGASLRAALCISL